MLSVIDWLHGNCSAGLILETVLDHYGCHLDSLTPGSSIEVLSSRQVVARGCVVKLGNIRGVGHRWGDLLVGSQKALIQIDEILKPNFKPPFRFTDRCDPDSNWPEKCNSVTWSSIHHKTSPFGGPQAHGYLDPAYFANCDEELDNAGVPPAPHL